MSDPTPIAVTSRTFSRHAALRGALEEHYPNVTYNDDGVALAGDALVDFLRGHPKAITALERLDGAVFRAVPELEVVSKFGVGLDSLDLDDLAAHGVRLGWTGGVNKRSVSELVIAFAISLLRHVPEANAGLRDGIWHKHVGRQFGVTGRHSHLLEDGGDGGAQRRLLDPDRILLPHVELLQHAASSSSADLVVRVQNSTPAAPLTTAGRDGTIRAS